MLSVASIRDKNPGSGKNNSSGSKKSAADYWLNLARDDYYTKGGEPPGKWFGRGAELLKLEGKVLDSELKPILDGYNPFSKEKLVKSAGSQNKKHMPCWDLAFSAPKGVSIIWALSDEETRHKIQEIQQRAVERALAFVEDKVAKTRRGANGIIEETPAGLIVSTFEHSTSRDQDPLLHTHCLVANVAPRKDGTWGALEGKRFYDWKMATGAYYRSVLADLLHSELGLTIERDKNYFRIAEVPRVIERLFSQRRETIKKIQSELGAEGAKALQKITEKSRNYKGIINRPLLFKDWQKKGLDNGFGKEKVSEILSNCAKNVGLDKDKTFNNNVPISRAYILEKLTENYSVFNEQDIYRILAEEAQGVVDPVNIQKQARSVLDHSDVLVLRKMGKHGKFEYCFSTVEMRNTDRAIALLAKKRLNEKSHGVNANTVSSFIASAENNKSASAGKPFSFSDDQKETIHHVFRSGGVCCVRGNAGAGKSTSLAVMKDVYQASGFNVIGLAFSGKVRSQLKSAGMESYTLDSFFLQIERNKMELSSNDVICLDEAGMVGSRHLFRLLSLADDVGAKVVLVGDEKQLQPIAAGAAFKEIEKLVGSFTLSTNFRQKEEWQKEAVDYFSQGESLKALEAYARNNCLVVSDSKEQALSSLIKDWRESIICNKDDSHVIIVNTRLDVTRLNELAREELVKLGLVEEGYLIPTASGKSIPVGVGDTLLLKKNRRLFGVDNGDLAKVERINISENAGLSQLRLRLENGKMVTLRVGEYNDYEHGYAVTTHKSQGSTIHRTFVVTGGDSMIDRETSYVQNSRHSISSKIYLDRESLEDQLDKLRPTEAMIEFAEDVSERKGIPLPDNYETSFRVTRQYLDDHSGKKLGFKDANGLLKGLEGLVHQMNISRQKETTLDYDVVIKSLFGEQESKDNETLENHHLTEYMNYEKVKNDSYRSSNSVTKESNLSEYDSYSKEAVEILYSRPYWDKDLVLDYALNNIDYIVSSLVSEECNHKLSKANTIAFGRKGSIRVDSNSGLVRDFERGYQTDIISYVSEMSGRDWYDALEWVASVCGLNPETHANTKLVISPEEQKKREDNKRKSQEAEARKKERSIKRARRVWENSIPIDDTLAEQYLREHRSISADLSKADFRYHPEAPDTVKDDQGDIKNYVTRPALVIGIRNQQSEIVSAQLVYLDPETGKKHPEAQVSKRTIASSWGYCAQIHIGKSNKVILAEGPETGASLISSEPDANIYISVGNNRNMGNLAYLAERHGTNEILFASDNDGPDAGSNIGLKAAACKLAEEGIFVKNSQSSPLPGYDKTDYNDLLKEEGVEGVSSALDNWEYIAMPDQNSDQIKEKDSGLTHTKNRDLER